MQSIVDLHSSVYLTSIGMNTMRQGGDRFDAVEGERPKPKSLFSRMISQIFRVISRGPSPNLKPVYGLFADRKLKTKVGYGPS